MEDIMRIVKSLEKFGFLIKDACETIEDYSAACYQVHQVLFDEEICQQAKE